MRKLSLSFSLLLALILTAATAEDCRWTADNGDVYDYSSLHQEGGYKMKDESVSEGSLFAIDIIFNFCGAITVNCNLDNTPVEVGAYEALEVLGQITDTCEILGKYDTHKVQKTTVEGADGINISYEDGDPCINSENSLENSQPQRVNFRVLCGSKGDWIQSPINSLTVTKCSKEFTITHPAGCANGISSARSSFFFFKLLIFIFVVYMIGGAIYNMRTEGKSGLESVPHIDFWRKVPNIAKNGVNRAVSKAGEFKGPLSQNSGAPAATDASKDYLTI